MFSCSKETDIKNQKPSVPTISVPANKAIDIATDITLKWNASIDPEKGAVSYTVYLGDKVELTQENILKADINTTEFKTQLKGHTTYYWKVVALDNMKAIAETEVYSFTTANSIPVKSEALFPVDKAINVTKDVVVRWSASTDADKDLIKYDLYVGLKEALDESDIKSKAIEATEYTLSLDGHTTYYWQVKASDGVEKAVNSNIYSFTTANTLPTKSVISNVVEKQVGDKLTADISWSASTDADADKIKYDVYFTKNDDFTEADIVAKDVETLKYTFTTVDFSTNYKIKVVAKDGFGGLVESDVKSYTSSAFKSKITIENLNITTPVVGFEGIPTSLEWNNAGKGVKYDLVVSANSDFTNAIVAVNNLTVNNYKFASDVKFVDATLYYVKVTAKDDYSANLVSNAFTFTYKVNETPVEDGTFTDARDGHVYKTVKIGDQVWLAENFAYVPEEDAGGNYLFQVPGVDPKTIAYSDIKNHENYKKYGMLYSLETINEKGFIPEGWHLATDEDWIAVEKAIGMTDEEISNKSGYRGDKAAKLKGKSGWTTNGTDDLGLNIIPAGRASFALFGGVSVKDFEIKAFFWTSTYLEVGYKRGNLYRSVAEGFDGVKAYPYSKPDRMSVRLVKNK